MDAGASGLKVFPAELVPPPGIKAIKAVLPPEVPVFVVGGIHAGNMGEYLAAGAAGFGIGGSLFKPGKSLSDIEKDAATLVAAFHNARETAE
jgi:2-dehydro-3-deoxyphosphogalactonate aldolase